MIIVGSIYKLFELRACPIYSLGKETKKASVVRPIMKVKLKQHCYLKVETEDGSNLLPSEPLSSQNLNPFLVPVSYHSLGIITKGTFQCLNYKQLSNCKLKDSSNLQRPKMRIYKGMVTNLSIFQVLNLIFKYFLQLFCFLH